jgi:hypothetical protein
MVPGQLREAEFVLGPIEPRRRQRGFWEWIDESAEADAPASIYTTNFDLLLTNEEIKGSAIDFERRSKSPYFLSNWLRGHDALAMQSNKYFLVYYSGRLGEPISRALLVSSYLRCVRLAWLAQAPESAPTPARIATGPRRAESRAAAAEVRDVESEQQLPDEASTDQLVLDTLANSKTAWLTFAEIAKRTGLSGADVIAAIERHSDLVREWPSPDKEGQPLFAFHTRSKTVRETLARLKKYLEFPNR